MRHVLALLADDVAMVEAGDCAQALRAVESDSEISLMLLDLNMPGRDGFAALETLSQRYPALPIVVLSGSESCADMQRALNNGAMGFIPKSAKAAVMLSALRLVLAGDVYLPPALVQPGAPSLGSPTSDTLLTPRQIEVLARVIEGRLRDPYAGTFGHCNRPD